MGDRPSGALLILRVEALYWLRVGLWYLGRIRAPTGPECPAGRTIVCARGLRAPKATGKGEDVDVVLNVNFPSCSEGSTRGVRAVPVGRSIEITGYTGLTTLTPVETSVNAFLSDCTSSLTDPTTDLEAMTNGFASVTPLAANLGASTRHVSEFLLLEQ